jgi:pimeloyl-ACP methyl ester carboxylesterase
VRLGCAAPTELGEEERAEIRSRLDRLVDALRLQRQPRYGVTFLTEDGERAMPTLFAPQRETMPERVVLLVHGLDDPGWLWRDVIEALHDAGFVVARVDYPNDGPIADAADLLMQSLLELRALGVVRVDIVAHSMGGLIARDVLTRSAYYGGDGRGDEYGPAIDRLIMCGTPNHGSTMARLRAVAGIGEHLSRLFSRANGLPDPTGLADGAGEAAVDLLPGSAFLTELNRRPLATHTKYTIIAGRISPLTEEQVREMGRELRETAAAAGAPAWLRDWLERAEDESEGILTGAVRGLGDGCVTIDSARLAGVEDVTVVEANHVGLIVNLAPSATPAPAIPIILDRLDRADEPARPHAGD